MSDNNDNLISNLRRWCYGGPVERGQFLTGKRWKSWQYFFDRDFLSNEEMELAGNYYHHASIQDFRQEVAFKQLCGILEENKISFAPLKGADLAWRVYPGGALRQKGDIDILIYPDDYNRAITVFERDGWETPYKSRHTHHHPPMIKNGIALEPHFSLLYFEKFDAKLIWSELRPPEKGFQYQLPRDFIDKKQKYL